MSGTVLAKGLVDRSTTLVIYSDGTFSTKTLFGGESARDTLLGFDHDVDSMRRKSVTGRGAAFLATGGLSVLASNNRGVVYVTVIGERSGVVTYTTRNPDGSLLTSIRSLKAATEVATRAKSADPGTAPGPSSGGADIVHQMKQLAELYSAGTLTKEEFAAAKARLLAD